MNQDDAMIGRVTADAAFMLLAEARPLRRLTAIQPQAAQSPQGSELDLSGLKGKVLEVQGIDQGHWIYSARVTTAQSFRANVGMILTNADGLVLALERAPAGSAQWQMPQGGLDELEEPQEAAERELMEELGLAPNRVGLVQQHREWLAYELPADARKAKHGRGQAQKWFLYRFLGSDKDIDLRGDPPEFAEFRWMRISDLIAITWEVRKPVYQKLASEFAGHLS